MQLTSKLMLFVLMYQVNDSVRQSSAYSAQNEQQVVFTAKELEEWNEVTGIDEFDPIVDLGNSIGGEEGNSIETRGIRQKGKPKPSASQDEFRNDTDSQCLCGIQPKRRIVGGHETKPNEYPWMAFMVYQRRFRCGGSLINNKYILTAAHCTVGVNVSELAIVLGAHNLTKEEPDRRIYKVKKIINHSRYIALFSVNDISLLQLEKEVEFNEKISPVCLPPPTSNSSYYDNQQVVVSGWGLIEEGGREVSPVLQKVQVTIIPNKVCNDKYLLHIFSSMMCAGETGGGKDSCQGDSGGPLMYQNDTQQSLIGVVSFGIGCARDTHPGVYTRVDAFLPWIKKNTNDAKYCATEMVLSE